MDGEWLETAAVMDFEETRRALLSGSRLTAVRDGSGTVTHYRASFDGRCCGVATFARLRHLLEEMGRGRWGLSARGRFRVVEEGGVAAVGVGG